MQRHAVTAYAAPTACRRTVSGTISLFCSKCGFTFPSRYWFTIGLSGVFGPYRMVGWFTQIPRAPRYSGYYYGFDNIRIRNYHALWSFFPESSSLLFSCNAVVLLPRLCRNITGLDIPRSLATTGGIIIIFFPAGTKMFPVPALASTGWIISLQDIGLSHSKSSDQRLFAPPRSLSQLITSFIASEAGHPPLRPWTYFLYYRTLLPVRDDSFYYWLFCLYNMSPSFLFSERGRITDSTVDPLRARQMLYQLS